MTNSRNGKDYHSDIRNFQITFHKKLINIFFFFFGHTAQLAGSQFPDQGLNPRPESESVEF